MFGVDQRITMLLDCLELAEALIEDPGLHDALTLEDLMAIQERLVAIAAASRGLIPDGDDQQGPRTRH